MYVYSVYFKSIKIEFLNKLKKLHLFTCLYGFKNNYEFSSKSNRVRKVRTPGDKLVFQDLKKRPSVPKCPMTGLKLKGVKPVT